MEAPTWGMMLKVVMPDSLRWTILRLADYDPVQAARIEEYSTILEIAEASVLKQHDNSYKHKKRR
jgi:hypothetical protein